MHDFTIALNYARKVKINPYFFFFYVQHATNTIFCWGVIFNILKKCFGFMQRAPQNIENISIIQNCIMLYHNKTRDGFGSYFQISTYTTNILQREIISNF